MAARKAEAGISGGPARHVPVMLDEVLSALRPGPGQTFIDGTFGSGGYSRALLRAGARVVAIDRDPDAIETGATLAEQYPGQLFLAKGEFGELDRHAADAGCPHIDGVTLDVGVSSMQIDEAERGFSFQADGPLDMRMSAQGVSAADLVNRASVNDLARIIGILGEERQAGRIARAIDARRAERSFARTLELADLVEKTIGRNPQARIHPATRTFQALRVFINRELEQLARALFAAERILREGGRLAVVTFHSLEDRIVKRFLAARTGGQAGSRHAPERVREQATFVHPARPTVIKAGPEEVAANPRARSAKLRHAMRTGVAAGVEDLAITGVPAVALASIKLGRV